MNEIFCTTTGIIGFKENCPKEASIIRGLFLLSDQVLSISQYQELDLIPVLCQEN
jgi:hypothetical protein